MRFSLMVVFNFSFLHRVFYYLFKGQASKSSCVHLFKSLFFIFLPDSTIGYKGKIEEKKDIHVSAEKAEAEELKEIIIIKDKLKIIKTIKKKERNEKNY